MAHRSFRDLAIRSGLGHLEGRSGRLLSVNHIRPLSASTNNNSVDSNNNDSKPSLPAKKPSFLSKEASEAPETYNRWFMVPPAVLTHLCIGGLYSWSVLNEPISRTLGVVSASSGDWALSSVIPVFSTAVCMAGATGALNGKWADKEGPRKSVFVAGSLWGGGLMLAGLGVETHNLAMLYGGYGLIGGVGIGFAYSPPVAALLRWFPDRKGLASGMVIMGFGSGALVALPIMRYLMELNFKAPKYFGSIDSVETIVEGGKRFLALDPAVEVVVASASDISKLGLQNIVLEPGLYAVGTGSTGVGQTLITIGAAYAITMLAASMAYKVPGPKFAPPAPVEKPSDNKTGETPQTNGNPLAIPMGSYVTASDAIRTRQFAQVWTSLFLNATAGIAVLGVAKTLMSEAFGSSMPTVVDASFCAAYVGALSLFNGLGRLAWAATSDVIGTQKTYSMFFMLGAPLYLSVPVAAHMAGSDGGGMVPLAMFTTSTLAIISMYGGGFSVSPAYLSTMFGNKEVGNIYGKLLTAWSMAGMIGPTMLGALRRQSEVQAIKDLTGKVDPAAFQHQFGEGVDKLNELIAANSVSINKLLQIAPPGTVDPSPYLYDSSMKVMSALLVLGLVNNAMMKPVDPKLIRKA